MKKIIICSASAKTEEQFCSAPIIKSATNTLEYYCKFVVNNTAALSKVYNDAINEYTNSNYSYMVLVHDDVWINCDDFATRVEKYLEKYTVFGLAGNTQIKVKEPVLWHLMTERENLKGCVAHGNPDNYSYTSFGPVVSRALLIDGVMIGINLKKLPKNVRFDENCPAKFHFYDLIFSMECALNKVPVGIADIPIIHESPGLSKVTEEWHSGQKYFIDKYKKFYNKTLTV